MTASFSAPDSLKSRVLADLVRSVDLGRSLQTTAVAVLVGRNPYDLVQKAAQDLGHADHDERLQLYLRNVVAVLSAAERHLGNVLAAVHWYRADRIAEGVQYTPEALVAAGRLEEVYRRLLRTSQPRT